MDEPCTLNLSDVCALAHLSVIGGVLLYRGLCRRLHAHSSKPHKINRHHGTQCPTRAGTATCPPFQIHQLGLPIRPAFWKDPRPTSELRAELGLEADTPAAMVMGGGDGVGGMGAIATAVIETLSKELERSQVSYQGGGGRKRGGCCRDSVHQSLAIDLEPSRAIVERGDIPGIRGPWLRLTRVTPGAVQVVVFSFAGPNETAVVAWAFGVPSVDVLMCTRIGAAIPEAR